MSINEVEILLAKTGKRKIPPQQNEPERTRQLGGGEGGGGGGIARGYDGGNDNMISRA
jgi:hypothetical protein